MIRSKHNPAFSLIEVMVVITIAALLLTAIVPLYQENVRRASIAKAVSKLSSMQSTLTEYYTATGQWPAELNSSSAGVGVADSDFPFVTNFVYDNEDNKAWYGYRLNAEYGTGWIFMALLYDSGTFQVHCGALEAGCGTYGSCNSTAYFPIGCDEEDLDNL